MGGRQKAREEEEEEACGKASGSAGRTTAIACRYHVLHDASVHGCCTSYYSVHQCTTSLCNPDDLRGTSFHVIRSACCDLRSSFRVVRSTSGVYSASGGSTIGDDGL